MLVFSVSSQRVDRRVGSRAGNLVQSVSDGANQIPHTITRGGGNGVEPEAALMAEITESFEARAIGGGVQLGGNDDHRFFDEARAEGLELPVDNFE